MWAASISAPSAKRLPIFAQAAGARLVYVGNEPPSPSSEAIVVPKGLQLAQRGRFEGQENRAEQGLERALPAGRALEKAGVPYKRDPADLPAAGRCARRLRARQRRRLGDLGPVPGRRREAAGRTGAGRRPGLVSNHQFYLATRLSPSRMPRSCASCSRKSPRSTTGDAPIRRKRPQVLSAQTGLPKNVVANWRPRAIPMA
jgi:sulfonate transport system substrate-binding protein